MRAALAVVLVLAVAIGAAAEPSNAARLNIPSVAGGTRVVNSSWVGPNAFRPSQCAGVTYSALLVVTGTSGTATDVNTLVIGNGSVSQNLNGGKAKDCIIGGGASVAISNALKGGGGGDILIGGKFAKQSYLGGSGSDTCYYRPNDAVPNPQACNTSILLP